MGDSAPLLSIPEAPAPTNGAAEWFEGARGARLRAALFRPEGRSRGSVILHPGRTEPIEKYFEVVQELQARGFVVLVHDWRGHGLSARLAADPIKGHARGWRLFMADHDALLTAFGPRLPKPWVALGHSMGGGLTALALAEGETRYAAAVLSAPMLAIRTGKQANGLARKAAWTMGLFGFSARYVWPQPPSQFDQRFEENILTHDRGRWNRYMTQLRACPDLRIGGLTWGWLAFALALSYRIERLHGVERITVPLSLVGAGDDKLCSNVAVRAVAARAPLGRYIEIPGAYHELLMETDDVRGAFWAEFDRVAESVAAV